MNHTSEDNLNIIKPVVIVYYLTLALFMSASFFPQYRLWGVSTWAYLPAYAPYLLFVIGAILPILLKPFINNGRWQQHVSTNRSYYISAILVIVVMATLFILLGAKTHFGGDGYSVLSSLSGENPLFKSREIGELLVHIWLKNILSGHSKDAALLSFQIISIGAGFIFLFTSAFILRPFFKLFFNQLIFFLGLVSGGYMILFFGYTEYYSLFVLSTILFTLTGILITTGSINKLLIIIPLVLAVFFHIMGVTLIPAALYILYESSKLEKIIKGYSLSIKIFIVLIITIVLLTIFTYYYTNSYFFRFAIIPIIHDKLTIEGYTLFSIKHLLDVLNLLFLLFPALLIFIIVLIKLQAKEMFKNTACCFLLIANLSTLGAIFIFDPKLGMPRDWDLFSFAGIPLAILAYYTIIDNRAKFKGAAYIVLLSICLGFLSLLPRAVINTSETYAIPMFKDYLMLDRIKNRQGWYILQEYYKTTNNQPALEKTKEEWASAYPEVLIFNRARELNDQGHYQKAAELNKQVIELNPMFHEAYKYLGMYYVYTDQLDSALQTFEIACGMNPYNGNIWLNLGRIYYQKKEYQKAENAWLKAMDLDTTFAPVLNLAQYYKKHDQPEKYYQYLVKSATFEEIPAKVIKELGDYYLQHDQLDKAVIEYKRAIKKGLDSSLIYDILNKYPELKRNLTEN